MTKATKKSSPSKAALAAWNALEPSGRELVLALLREQHSQCMDLVRRAATDGFEELSKRYLASAQNYVAAAGVLGLELHNVIAAEVTTSWRFERP